MDAAQASTLESRPSLFRYIIGFLLVGMAWGLTTPFMRVAAIKEDQRKAAIAAAGRAPQDVQGSWLRRQVIGIHRAVLDLLKRPGYLVPLVINLTGSVWFFLLVGKAGKR